MKEYTSSLSLARATSSEQRSQDPPATSATGTTARQSRRSAGEALFAYLLLTPTIALLGVLVAYPIAKTVLDSFEVTTSSGSRGFGLGNYSFSLSDPAFVPAVRNTLIWALISMVVAPTVGLIGAALVEDGPVTHKALFRFCFFAPYLLSLAAAGAVFVQMLDPTFGLVHAVLALIGLGSVRVTWLGNPTDVLWVAIVLFLWNQTPFCFLVMSSAIRQIDREMYDAALIDGASGLGRFKFVTRPTVQPVMRSLRFIMLIVGLTPFAVLFVLVTSNSQTQIVPTLIYNYGIQGTNQGEAGAMSAMFAGFLACVVLGFGYLVTRRWSRAA